MTAPTMLSKAALLEETVDLILDTGNALSEVLASSMPYTELEAIVREMAAEVLDTYQIVVSEHDGAGR